VLGITSIYAAYGNRNISEERTARADYTIHDIMELLHIIDQINTGKKM